MLGAARISSPFSLDRERLFASKFGLAPQVRPHHPKLVLTHDGASTRAVALGACAVPTASLLRVSTVARGPCLKRRGAAAHGPAAVAMHAQRAPADPAVACPSAARSGAAARAGKIRQPFESAVRRSTSLFTAGSSIDTHARRRCVCRPTGAAVVCMPASHCAACRQGVALQGVDYGLDDARALGQPLVKARLNRRFPWQGARAPARVAVRWWCCHACPALACAARERGVPRDGCVATRAGAHVRALERPFWCSHCARPRRVSPIA